MLKAGPPARGAQKHSPVGPGGPAIAFDGWLLVHRFLSRIAFSIQSHVRPDVPLNISFRAVRVTFFLIRDKRVETLCRAVGARFKPGPSRRRGNPRFTRADSKEHSIGSCEAANLWGSTIARSSALADRPASCRCSIESLLLLHGIYLDTSMHARQVQKLEIADFFFVSVPGCSVCAEHPDGGVSHAPNVDAIFETPCGTPQEY